MITGLPLNGGLYCAHKGRLIFYLFELNVVELTSEGRVLQQLQDKGYAEKYRALGQPIYLIGVEFSHASRNMVGFEIG